MSDDLLNIDKYRTKFECDEHWELRRKFLLSYQYKYPEDRLVCLSQTYTNIKFLGCRYPEETMKNVAFLAQGIMDEVGEKPKGQRHETSVAGSDVPAMVKGGKPETNHLPSSVPERQHTHSADVLVVERLPDNMPPLKLDQLCGSSVGCVVSENVLSATPHHEEVPTQNSSQKTVHVKAELEKNPFVKLLMVEDFGNSARSVLGQIMSSCKINFCYRCKNVGVNKVRAVLFIKNILVSQFEGCSKNEAKSGAAKSALIELRKICCTVKGSSVADVKTPLPEVGSKITCKETLSRSGLNLGEKLYGMHHNELLATRKLPMAGKRQARDQLCQLIQCFLVCARKEQGDDETFASEFAPDKNGAVPRHPKKRKKRRQTLRTLMMQGIMNEFREKQEGQLCENSVAARVKARKRKANPMPSSVPEKQHKHSAEQQASVVQSSPDNMLPASGVSVGCSRSETVLLSLPCCEDVPTHDTSQENIPMNKKPKLGNVVIVEDFGNSAWSVMARSMAACKIKSRYQYEKTLGYVKAKLLLDDVLVSVGGGCTVNKAREEAARFALMEFKKTCYTLKAKPEFVRGTTVHRSLWEKLCPPVLDQSKMQETWMADVDTPLPDNVGSNIMRKMGWTGGALGRNTVGITEPISVVRKTGCRSGLGLVEKKINKQVKASKKLVKAARKMPMLKFRQQVDSFLQDYASQDKEEDLIFISREFMPEEYRKIRKTAFRMKLECNTYIKDEENYLVVSKKISFRDEAEKLLSGCSSDKYELIPPNSHTSINHMLQLSSGSNLHSAAESVTCTASA